MFWAWGILGLSLLGWVYCWVNKCKRTRLLNYFGFIIIFCFILVLV
ncbi:hypothetical protein F383_15357 [Gossypium arboreum]|uniref:Uncharacterized protein n=1 Tax=Gossypium arboreum TaxID=29729 RepID=A0A0B0NDB1_GOSAR|nr:hypothetical protein F383_15357 [Gossypium arboreum]